MSKAGDALKKSSNDIIECPRPKTPQFSVYEKGTINVRIRESVHEQSGRVSSSVVSKMKILKDKNADIYHVEIDDLKSIGNVDTIRVGLKDIPSLLMDGLDLTNQGNLKFTTGLKLFGKILEHYDTNGEGYGYGDVAMTFVWAVKRKEVEVQYPGGRYMRLFYADKDCAGGEMTCDYDKNGKLDKILEVVLVEGQEPLLYRYYYKNFDDNNAIAKDAALMKCGFMQIPSPSQYNTRLQNIGYNTNFKYGSYGYYQVQII